jgi:hypothetical protein
MIQALSGKRKSCAYLQNMQQASRTIVAMMENNSPIEDFHKHLLKKLALPQYPVQKLHLQNLENLEIFGFRIDSCNK